MGVWDSYDGGGDGSFVAKWGGKTCPRCGRLVEKGQMIRYGADRSSLFHTFPCPPPSEISSSRQVVFRYACGCKAGECVHFPGE